MSSSVSESSYNFGEAFIAGDAVTIAARAAGMVPVLIERNYEGNAFDFSVNKHNMKQEISISGVRTITKLSELLTQFL